MGAVTRGVLGESHFQQKRALAALAESVFAKWIF